MELPLMLKQFEADYKAELLGERLLATPRHYAYLKISEGCNRTCAFCAIPLMRGGHISRRWKNWSPKRKAGAERGKGNPADRPGTDLLRVGYLQTRMLPELLHRLADIKGLEWIRLHYAYPSKFPLEILDVIRERDNICKYLDMPLQHASDNMLTAMRRQITRQEMTDLIHTIREKSAGHLSAYDPDSGFPRRDANRTWKS
jgi:ribosomal protein S12 methylthiotransferase